MFLSYTHTSHNISNAKKGAHRENTNLTIYQNHILFMLLKDEKKEEKVVREKKIENFR